MRHAGQTGGTAGTRPDPRSWETKKSALERLGCCRKTVERALIDCTEDPQVGKIRRMGVAFGPDRGVYLRIADVTAFGRRAARRAS